MSAFYSSCYYCLTVFPKSSIVIDHDTEFCPNCGIDAVKHNISKQEMIRLNEHYFGSVQTDNNDEIN